MIEWLREKVFPDAISAGSFGTNVKKFVSFKLSGARPASDEFFSSMILGNVILEDSDGKHITESVVIKKQAEKSFLHALVNMNAHYHNEILFYTEIVPLLRKYDTGNYLSNSLPEFIYGRTTNGQNPEEDVIILKNLRKKGFREAKEKLFLDENHISLILDRVSKYHALSYKCLHDNPEPFQKILSKIQDEVCDYELPDFLPKYAMHFVRFRGIAPLRRDPKYRDRLSDIYEHCASCFAWKHVCEQLFKPSKPLSVLIHGKLVSQNFMFRYDSDGQPEEVALLGWGAMKFCSPIIDISSFLMLHTSPESKRLYWDEFLRTYYNALSCQLDVYPHTKPSFEDIELEMRKKGVYGYHTSVYSLPLCLETGLKELIELLDPESKIWFWMEYGGAKATEYLSEIVKHMLDRNFIFEYANKNNVEHGS